MQRLFITTTLLFGVLLTGCATNVGQVPPPEEPEVEEAMEEDEEDKDVESAGGTMLVEYFCEAPEHMHPQGMLTAQYEDGVLVGWTCTLSSHHICTAPVDGVWTECTFEPPGWPEPVAQKFLQNPPPEEEYEGGEEAY